MSASRPTVVLLPGPAADGGPFADLVAAWDDAGDVVAPDLPVPTGDSDVDPDAAVRAVVEAVRASGAHRWLLVGRGTAGGELAALVAARTLDGTLPVFGLAGVVVLAGSSPLPESVSGQLAALDLPTLVVASGQPSESIDAIDGFWRDRASLGPVVPPEQAALIASERVTARVRGALARRAVADDPSYVPQVLNPEQLATLRAVADHVVPQGDAAIDLAARVDARLANGAGDGWRHTTLPDDVTAYGQALSALTGFVDLAPDARDDVLEAIAAGRHTPPGSALTAAQLALWFEDARDDLTRQWVSHPATAAAVGFDAFADGGDRTGRLGFVELGAGIADTWEPGAIRNLAPDAGHR